MEFSKTKRWTLCVAEGPWEGQTTDGPYGIFHSVLWGDFINSFFSWSFFSIVFLSFWVQPTNIPEK